MVTWNEILITIVQTVSYAIIAFGLPVLFNILKSKVKNEQALKLVDVAQSTVIDTVAMVNQTFVDDLKKQGNFNASSQAEAFKICKDRILALLNDSAKEAVIMLHTDLEAWIENQIESSVKALKTA